MHAATCMYIYTLHVSYHTERIEEHNTEPMYDYIDTDPGDILTNGNPGYGEVATTSDDHMNKGMRGAVDIRVAANKAYGTSTQIHSAVIYDC